MRLPCQLPGAGAVNEDVHADQISEDDEPRMQVTWKKDLRETWEVHRTASGANGTISQEETTRAHEDYA